MELSVLIEPTAGAGFRATSGEPLPAAADGPTRAAALDNLRAALEARLRTGAEVVRLRVGPDAGPVWPDDPLTRDWLDGIAAARAAADPWDADPAGLP